jgi:3-oxoacyl-[acyl-carrier protein] reductase
MNVLITGGASGLGEAMTRKLARNKEDRIFFTYKGSVSRATSLQTEFSNAKAIQCDFGSEASINALLQQIEQMDPDVLINNAFTGLQTNYFHKTEASYFSENFNRNVMPVIRISQAAIHHFRKKKSGKIITVLTSYLINKPPVGLSEYVAAKNYLLSLSKSWAVENAKFNITSNCISPSFMKTELTRDTDERVIEAMVNAHPLKRLLEPAEVADAIEYMLRASAQLNGTNLIINSAEDIL